MRGFRLGFSFSDLLVFVSVLSIIIGVSTSSFTSARESKQQATFNFERRSSFWYGLCSVDVFVNNVKVGTVRNGKKMTFNFTPSPDGNNVVYAELIAILGSNKMSQKIEFEANPRAVVSAISDIDKWGGVDLRVGIEKKGQALSPTEEKTSYGTDLSDVTPSSTMSMLHWTIVGAIGSVGCLLVAIYTLSKKKIG